MPNTKKPKIQIDIISDVVCPWCYIGKKRLEKALNELKNDYTFELHYKPFQLNPDIPEGGFNQAEYLISKFGGEARYKELTSYVSEVATQEGLHFRYDKQKIAPNTFNLHRLIWLAEKNQMQLPVVDILFKAYFEEGADLSKTENLVNLGVKAGLTEEQVGHLFHSKEGASEVREAEALNRQLGIRSVPFFIINGKYGISGAQSSTVFIEALHNVGNIPDHAESCDINNPEC